MAKSNTTNKMATSTAISPAGSSWPSSLFRFNFTGWIAQSNATKEQIALQPQPTASSPKDQLNHQRPERSAVSKDIKRYCQTAVGLVGDVLHNPSLLDMYVEARDPNGLIELMPTSLTQTDCHHSCALCNPEAWLFGGSYYDSSISILYAEKDGCIPSSIVTNLSKFIIPWRYKNKRTGEISWKIYHLHKDKINGAENETIIVNPYKDKKLRTVIDYVWRKHTRYPIGTKLVEFLLKVVQETLGDYGLAGGPTSADADVKIHELMMRQGHNFLLLCDVVIGVCRHKALLFKLLCDTVKLKCAVITGYSTAGRHQWNIVSLDSGDFLIDPTSRHFTWTRPGSNRTKGYKVLLDDSMGHAGFTLCGNQR